MTTDELLKILPSAIGNHKEGEFYILSKPTDQYEGLYLHNDGKDWLASYGVSGEFVCMNPEAPDENGFYNNAHHFDYRGLIEKRLALEAKEEMYPSH